MSNYAYPVARDTFGGDELAAAEAVLASGRYTMGARVAAFEEAFARWIGSPYAVMVNSGSSANLLMVEAMLRGAEAAWEPGDEVLVPALSWPTTVWPLVQLGLIPVFTDIDADTLAIDLDSAAGVVGPRTKGMFLIHVLGQTPDMGSVAAFNAAHDLELLEDTCEALGAHHGGRHAGTMGRMGSFSFYFSHHLTTIEGGMVATASPETLDDLRSMRSHGWSRDRRDRDRWAAAQPDIDPRFLFVGTGYNLRPTEINAAIGLVQLDRLEKMLVEREEIASAAAGMVERIPWLRLIGAERLSAPHVEGRPWREHSWMMLPLVVADDAPVDPAVAVATLEEARVETRPIVAGNLVRHPAMRNIAHRAADSLANADRLLDRGFMIGCHPQASTEGMEHLERAFTNLEQL